ncbi:MAG: DNA-processing protein DprA [Patescibacteria group bacterium]
MSSQPQNPKYFLGFSLIDVVGAKRFKQIYAHFNDLELAWQASTGEFIRAGFSEKLASQIVAQRNKINLDEQLERLNRLKINFITLESPEYPALLKQIYDPPFVIFYKGTLNSIQDEFCLAVVGSRKFSPYGKQITQDIVSNLAKNKITIVSGLALGIDALAHQTTVEAKGRTIAVMGCGLDQIYPAVNYNLAQQILNSFGALISEYPPGVGPLRFNFPMRNRIISGLSLGTLVIEAGEESGSLITAKSALDQNREVFAVPGNIYSTTCQGTNDLIKQGAKMVTSAQDILETLNLKQVTAEITSRQILPDSPEEAKVLEHLSAEPTHVDKLLQLSQLSSAQLNATLTMMEIKGKIKNLGGSNYVLAR